MTFLTLLTYGLATFRLSLMISKEDGPAWIFAKLRRLPPKRSSAKEGLSCPWCLSIWFGGLIAIYWSYFAPIKAIECLILLLALSALGILFNQTFTKDK